MTTITFNESKVSKEYIEGVLTYYENTFNNESDATIALSSYEIGTIESALWSNGFMSQ